MRVGDTLSGTGDGVVVIGLQDAVGDLERSGTLSMSQGERVDGEGRLGTNHPRVVTGPDQVEVFDVKGFL